MKDYDISVRMTLSQDNTIRSLDYRNLMFEIHEIKKRCKAFSNAIQPGCLEKVISDFFSAVQGNPSEL
jgi:hypothetical protein